MATAEKREKNCDWSIQRIIICGEATTSGLTLGTWYLRVFVYPRYVPYWSGKKRLTDV